MDRDHLLAFVREHRLAIQSTVAPNGSPQSAVVGIAVTDRFEIVFDTLATSRKARNLRANPRISLVIGGLTPGDERTVQLEGIADEPNGDELAHLTEAYYAVFPDGRERAEWPALIYVRVCPHWIRYSDYNVDPPEVTEFSAAELVR